MNICVCSYERIFGCVGGKDTCIPMQGARGQPQLSSLRMLSLSLWKHRLLFYLGLTGSKFGLPSWPQRPVDLFVLPL